ncbi:antitoxin [Rhodococcus sp. NPDC060086]|uniref:antitoxin n=1 Tax=unclassified Rhodococcus (in: high G+C Gram-positive bacteria) TaxID=192944 RepID=UPI0036475FA0
MGLMDSLKGLLGKGKDYASQNPDKVQGYIDKAGDTVDGKTGGKYSQHVDKAQDAAKKHLGTSGNPAPGAQPGAGGDPGPQSDPGPEAQPGPRTP